MPTYNYKCNTCENVTEELLSIANRKLPESVPCDECGGEVSHILNATMTVAGVALRDRKPDFFRDTLKDMKKIAGKENTLNRVL